MEERADHTHRDRAPDLHAVEEPHFRRPQPLQERVQPPRDPEGTCRSCDRLRLKALQKLAEALTYNISLTTLSLDKRVGFDKHFKEMFQWNLTLRKMESQKEKGDKVPPPPSRFLPFPFPFPFCSPPPTHTHIHTHEPRLFSGTRTLTQLMVGQILEYLNQNDKYQTQRAERLQRLQQRKVTLADAIQGTPPPPPA